nr:MAG TPA: hypothetical protein [Caudoviricetes sp.]
MYTNLSYTLLFGTYFGYTPRKEGESVKGISFLFIQIKNPTATNSRTSSKLTSKCFYCTQFYHKGAQQWNK